MKLETSHSVKFELADLKVDGSNMKNKSVNNKSGLGFIIQNNTKLLSAFLWPIIFRPDIIK
jgi:hypothetical protein